MSHYEAYLLAVTYYLLKTRIKRLSESETEAEEPHAHTHTLLLLFSNSIYKKGMPATSKGFN